MRRIIEVLMLSVVGLLVGLSASAQTNPEAITDVKLESISSVEKSVRRN